MNKCFNEKGKKQWYKVNYMYKPSTAGPMVTKYIYVEYIWLYIHMFDKFMHLSTCFQIAIYWTKVKDVSHCIVDAIYSNIKHKPYDGLWFHLSTVQLTTKK